MDNIYNNYIKKKSLQIGGFLISYKSFLNPENRGSSFYFAVAGFEDGVGEGFCFTSTMYLPCPMVFSCQGQPI